MKRSALIELVTAALALATLLPSCEIGAQRPQRGLSGLTAAQVEVQLGFAENVEREPNYVGNRVQIQERLQTQAELKLRNAGLRVLPNNLQNADPLLWIRMSVVESQSGLSYAFKIAVELHDMVLVKRNGITMRGVTYQNSFVSIVGGLQSAAALSDVMQEYIDEFLNAWHRENGR